jgi:hypothetical protein
LLDWVAMKLQMTIWESRKSQHRIRRCLLALLPLLCGLVAPVQAQQDDGSFREFNRTLVPTPAELFQTLSAFDAGDGSRPDSNSKINESVLKQLKQLKQSGQELLSRMSPEQKAKAREVADQFLSENGLESEAGKALMKQLGIPPELQAEFAQQVKSWDPEDKQRFSSLAEMFTQNQNRSSNQGSTGPSSGTNSAGKSGTGTRVPDSNRSAPSRDLGQSLQKAAGNLGTAAQQKAAASTLKNVLDSAKKTLSGSTGETAKPKERLTSRFDRLLVEAAKRSWETASSSSSKLELPESVESMFERVLGKVQDTIISKRNSQAAIPPDDLPPRKKFNADRVAESSVNATGRNADQSNDAPSATSAAGSSDLMAQLFELPKLDSSRLLLFMAIIGLAVFLTYLAWEYLAKHSAVPSKRALVRRFRSARIRSPKDLVEAVDQVIVRKFGADSRWWNARHAKEVLCSTAPQFRASISELLNDYVRARYSLNEPVLSEELQKQYKMTLKELSNLGFDATSVAEATIGNGS